MSWDFIDLFVRMILVASNRKSNSTYFNKGNLLAHVTEKIQKEHGIQKNTEPGKI